MTAVAIIAIVIALAIAAVLIYAATKPDTFRYGRTKHIQATPEQIWPLIIDLKEHHAWSPFEKDPNMKRTHSGAASGPGAVYEWSGNREVGSGKLELVGATAPSRVQMKLHMYKPMKALNDAEFILTPNGGGTDFTWAMHGAQPYMGKLFGTFVDCEKMCGTMFEEGLGKLKALAEKPALRGNAA
jgi:uncharacterized protein YndB with AHSA1/START domain